MRRVILLVNLILVSLFTVITIRAHGGGDLIAGPQPVGPYLVSIWLNPPDPRATEPIHFTVGLASPINREPILDAQIMVEMRPAGENRVAASGPATTEQSINKLFYETDLLVEDANTFETTFIITGSKGDGSLIVPVNVTQPSNINWMIVGLMGLALIVFLGWLRSRRVERERGGRDEIPLKAGT